jgi:integrase/recombinase XerC
MRDKDSDPFELACAAIAAVAAKDVAAEARRWLGFIAHERRLSPKTLEAYSRDVAGFLGFLAEHLGAKPRLNDLARLEPL